MTDGPGVTESAQGAWYRPMRGRNPREAHRASTPLELLFDLCFVVAVALAAARLHHALAEGHPGSAILGYGMVFFAIWWAWMNFTWFASAYDTDDLPYRLTTLVQIAGALILAAGVPRAFDGSDFAVVTLGYVIMRVALIAQWLRAAGADPERRSTNVRYALGVGVCQVGWVLRLLLPSDLAFVSFLALVLVDVGVPIWAERTAPSVWHPGHITERYGLFTLIVLGESILAATTAIQVALDGDTAATALVIAAASGLLIVFAMWWVYFGLAEEESRPTTRVAFIWGYGHLFIFAAAAAVGAGLQVAIDNVTGVAHIPARDAGLALAVPIAIYLLSLWVIYDLVRRRNPVELFASPLAALLILVATLTPWPLPLIALLLAARVATAVLAAPREREVAAVAHH